MTQDGCVRASLRAGKFRMAGHFSRTWERLNLQGPAEQLVLHTYVGLGCSRAWRRPCVPSRRQIPFLVQRVPSSWLFQP
jgi:hypothetical protein